MYYHISRLPSQPLIKTIRQMSQIYDRKSLLNIRRENIRNYSHSREVTYRLAMQGCVRLHKHDGRLSQQAKLSGEEFTTATPSAAPSIVNLNNSRMLITTIGLAAMEISCNKSQRNTTDTLSGESRSPLETKRMDRFMEIAMNRSAINYDSRAIGTDKYIAGGELYLRLFTFTFLEAVDMIGETHTHIHT